MRDRVGNTILFECDLRKNRMGKMVTGIHGERVSPKGIGVLPNLCLDSGTPHQRDNDNGRTDTQ